MALPAVLVGIASYRIAVCFISEPLQSYYHYCERKEREMDVDLLALRSEASRYFNESRGSAGSRMLRPRFVADGVPIGRFKVRRLMREAYLVSG